MDDPSCCSAPAHDHRSLPDLDVLTEALVSARPGTGALVGLVDSELDRGDLHCGDPHAGELLLQPTGPGGPFAQLVGWWAPVHWRAVGVIGPATVHCGGEPQEAGMALLVHRSGATSVSIALDGAPRPLDVDGAVGRLVDACRRALRLPTPPLRTPPAAWFAQRWLDELVAALAGGEAPDWGAAARLHPLSRLVEAPGDLEALARHPAARASWEDLRLTVALGHGDATAPEARLAAWMDAPMFGRWLLDARPPLDELAAAVADLAPPVVAQRVAATLPAWR